MRVPRRQNVHNACVSDDWGDNNGKCLSDEDVEDEVTETRSYRQNTGRSADNYLCVRIGKSVNEI